MQCVIYYYNKKNIYKRDISNTDYKYNFISYLKKKKRENTK